VNCDLWHINVVACRIAVNIDLIMIAKFGSTFVECTECCKSIVKSVAVLFVFSIADDIAILLLESIAISVSIANNPGPVTVIWI